MKTESSNNKIIRVDFTRDELLILGYAVKKMIDEGLGANQILATDKIDLQPLHNVQDRINSLLNSD